MDDEILEGLRQAISKGESLKDAMQSFYNAGYLKKDIEDAARRFQYSEQTEKFNKPISKPAEKNPSNSIFRKSKSPEQRDNAQVQQEPPRSSQKVSDYVNSEEMEKLRKKKIILISILLAVTAAIIFAIFFFRENLIGFLNNIFVK